MAAEENIDSNHEDVKDLEHATEPELGGPHTCCRCSQDTEDGLESESCGHSVCVDCRFEDSVQCTFCASTNGKKAETTTETDVGLCSLGSLSYIKKKLINKDHIINVQGDCASIVAKQMCTVCNRVFLKTNARYHYGCASGEKPLECTECGQKFVKKSHLEAHLNSHFGIKPFKCAVKNCNSSFTQKDKLLRHIKTHSSEKHECQVCGKMFSSLPILQFHMQKVHTTAKLFKCDMCPRTYKYKRTLTVHRLKHQGLKKYLCEICGKKYTLEAQLKQHKLSHISISRRPFKCRRHCKQRFITRHDKTRHELIHDNTGSPDYECSLCNTTFGRKDNLERHMKNFHQEEHWNPGKPVKVTAAVPPSKINKSILESDVTINCRKTNKSAVLNRYGKINHCKTVETCSKGKNKKNMCKNRDQVKKKKKYDKQLSVREAVKPFPTVNPTEGLSHSGPDQMESVIVRPSVIKNVPKLLPLRALPLEGKPSLEVDTLSVRYRIISHTDAVKKGNFMYKDDHLSVRCMEDNTELVLNGHYKPSHNITRRDEKGESEMTTSRSHPEQCLPQLAGPSTFNLHRNYYYNSYRLSNLSCNHLPHNEFPRIHMNCDKK